ncbi:MAG: hypothetical protein ABJM43_14270 [Paracoccaceae bacterium]
MSAGHDARLENGHFDSMSQVFCLKSFGRIMQSLDAILTRQSSIPDPNPPFIAIFAKIGYAKITAADCNILNRWFPWHKPARQFRDMTNKLVYSRKQWAAAVVLSALFGWACVTLPYVVLIGPVALLYGAIFGLPIAFLCCWIIVAPILNFLMRHEITLGRSAFWGGSIPALLSLLWISVERYFGWQTSLNPLLSTNLIGGTGYNQLFIVTEIDGVLTMYGWLMVGTSTLIFTAIGVLIAVLVRSLIGEPHARSDEN